MSPLTAALGGAGLAALPAVLLIGWLVVKLYHRDTEIARLRARLAKLRGREQVDALNERAARRGVPVEDDGPIFRFIREELDP